MKKGLDPTDYLQDILDNINRIESFIAGMSLDDFRKDTRTAYAVVRALEIIGEATKQIPESIRQECPEIPWSEIARMRDKLIHQYFGVDLAVVWNTVMTDVMPLRICVQRLLSAALGDSGVS